MPGAAALRRLHSIGSLQCLLRARAAFLRLLKEAPEARRARLAGLGVHETVASAAEGISLNLAGLANANKWSMAGRSTGSGATLNGTAISTRAKGGSRELLTGSGTTVTEVGDPDALAEVPYWNQGNAELYTDEALRARHTLRRHPRIQEKLGQWWTMLLRSSQGSNGAKLKDSVGKKDYCWLLCLLYKALLDPFDLDEARESAEEDWEQDTRGHPAMTRHLFMDAMFELVDMWTTNIEVKQYVEFLSILLDSVACDNGNGYTWRNLNEVHFAGFTLEDGADNPPDPVQLKAQGSLPAASGDQPTSSQHGRAAPTTSPAASCSKPRSTSQPRGIAAAPATASMSSLRSSASAPSPPLWAPKARPQEPKPQAPPPPPPPPRVSIQPKADSTPPPRKKLVLSRARPPLYTKVEPRFLAKNPKVEKPRKSPLPDMQRVEMEPIAMSSFTRTSSQVLRSVGRVSTQTDPRHLNGWQASARSRHHSPCHVLESCCGAASSMPSLPANETCVGDCVNAFPGSSGDARSAGWARSGIVNHSQLTAAALGRNESRGTQLFIGTIVGSNAPTVLRATTAPQTMNKSSSLPKSSLAEVHACTNSEGSVPPSFDAAFAPASLRPSTTCTELRRPLSRVTLREVPEEDKVAHLVDEVGGRVRVSAPPAEASSPASAPPRPPLRKRTKSTMTQRQLRELQLDLIGDLTFEENLALKLRTVEGISAQALSLFKRSDWSVRPLVCQKGT
ncbi:hypothetical protein AB1Y20_014188 [Prymnesium parvum]|uniref:Uncharacterized protein n=1 Tax=Prymnesium parvum TaxID=97485 RepID=A0AB34IFJ0_PRYPA